MKRSLFCIFVILTFFILTSCSAWVKPEHKVPEDIGLSRVEKSDGNGCGGNTLDDTGAGDDDKTTEAAGITVDPAGDTISTRFDTPDGFERTVTGEDTFGAYLRHLPLKPHGSKVRYFDGRIKNRNVHEAVIDIDVGDRDLQQCADAVMRLWAEYLYGREMYDKIHFNFTNGFNADYPTWAEGNRIVVENNKAWWVKRADYSVEYGSFRKYLDMVFAYAGTQSLANEMKKSGLENIRIGDVFLKGDLPGHCVIVVDMAENKSNGEKLFMIAQSYMPAQDIHILKNPGDGELSPWYTVDFGDKLVTPEWEFTKDQLYRF